MSLPSMARPGRIPLLVASPATGALTDEESTSAIDPPSVQASATACTSRTAPRKTDSNADRHCSSVIALGGPGGGPPTLTSAPSSRPHRSVAAATSCSAVAGSALSAMTGSTQSSAMARRDAAVSSSRGPSRPVMTTCAPSATSASAVARPRPRDPPVTT